MFGNSVGTIHYLMSATRSSSSNYCCVFGISDFWKQGVFSNLHTQIIMLFFIPKRTRHSATTGIYDSNCIIFRNCKHFESRFCAAQRFLLTMAVNFQYFIFCGKTLRSNLIFFKFLFDKFFNGEGVF